MSYFHTYGLSEPWNSRLKRALRGQSKKYRRSEWLYRKWREWRSFKISQRNYTMVPTLCWRQMLTIIERKVLIIVWKVTVPSSLICIYKKKVAPRRSRARLKMFSWRSDQRFHYQNLYFISMILYNYSYRLQPTFPLFVWYFFNVNYKN